MLGREGQQRPVPSLRVEEFYLDLGKNLFLLREVFSLLSFSIPLPSSQPATLP